MKGTSSCRLVECCGSVDDGRAAALTEQGAAGLFWAKRTFGGLVWAVYSRSQKAAAGLELGEIGGCLGWGPAFVAERAGEIGV